MIKKLFVVLSVLIAITELSIAANNYIWPMKLNPELTSKFCDYRAGHFHGGLDMRTGGRIGVPVFAIDDGYVWRAATSFRGYGKALYIKLNDGRLIVLGHLSGYFNTLAERILAAQLKDKKYTQDLYFTHNEFPVKQGQLIAYSGESGTGAPHLHFEMRSSLNNPINPLESGYSMPDKIPPEFDYLAIRYYKHQFNPGNPCEIEFMPVIKSKDGKGYFISDTLISDDYIALAIAGGDRINGSGFFYGYYQLRLFCDDSLLFEMKSDSLSYNTTRQLNYVRDLELIRLFAKKNKTDNDLGIFYRLYVPPGCNQYFWPAFSDNSGIIAPDSKPGSVRKIRVEALDESGNKSELRFFQKTPEITIPESISYYRNRDTLAIDFLTTTKIKNAAVEYRDNPAQAYKSVKYILSSKATIGGAFENHMRLNAPAGSKEYRISIRNLQNHVSPWTCFHEAAPDDKFALSGSPEHLLIQFPSKYTGLKLEITTSEQKIITDMISDGPNSVRSDIFDKSLSGPARLTIRNGTMVVFDTSLVFYPITPGKACEILSADSTLAISFQTNSAFYPSYVWPSNGAKGSTVAGIGTVYDIEPDFLLADAPLMLNFDTGRLGLEGKKVGAYGYSYGNNGWNFIGKIDGSRLEANAFGLGKVSLLEDNDPPVIGSITPTGATKSRTPFITCTISDRLSGLALDSGLSMTIDGAWVPAEYDIDGGRFSYKVRNHLKGGKHRFEIKAIDNQGNSATRVIDFTVSGK